MNDLDELRAFRADIPPASPERLAPGRARLLTAATGRPRSLPRRRLVGAVGVLGAAAATGVAVLPDEGAAPRPLATRPMSATEFLERAARSAESKNQVTPKPKQWIYTKTYHADVHGSEGTGPQRVESWSRVDGRKSARYHEARLGGPTRLVIENETWMDDNDDSEERTAAQWLAYFYTLPPDPEGLLAAIYARADAYNAEWKERGRKAVFDSAEGRDQWVFQRLTGFLSHSATLPWSLRPSIYRAVARIPGVVVHENATDALGRRGAAIVRSGPPGIRDEFIIAPGTYAYLGHRAISTKEQVFPSPLVAGRKASSSFILPAGRTMFDTALEAWAIVDRAGQRRP